MALAESSMSPHPIFFPILTLNTSVPTRMDWEEELRAILFTIKSCVFVSSSLICQVCVCWAAQWMYVANVSLQIKQNNQPQLECAAVLEGKEGLLTPGGSSRALKHPGESGRSRD